MAVDRTEQEKSSGAATDAFGNPVPDPTKNVLDLVEAAVLRINDVLEGALKRQDDLRVAADLRVEAESRHLREIMDIRERFYRQLRDKESERIDAIRAVDAGAIQRRDEVAAASANALAQQLIATADAARLARESDAAQTRNAMEAALGPMRDDIRALRDAQSSYQGGKEQSTDTRLNIGAVVGAAGFVVGIVLAVVGFALR